MISPLQGADSYQKSNSTLMLKEGNIPLVLQSAKKRNKNKDEIKKEKEASSTSKSLDYIFNHCREVPKTVKRILLGKGTLTSDFKCIFQRQITLTV